MAGITHNIKFKDRHSQGDTVYLAGGWCGPRAFMCRWCVQCGARGAISIRKSVGINKLNALVNELTIEGDLRPLRSRGGGPDKHNHLVGISATARGNDNQGCV